MGWTLGAPLVNIGDSEKYIFKFIEETNELSISSKITCESNVEFDDIEDQIAKLDGPFIDPKRNVKQENSKSPVLSCKGSLKRKVDKNSNNNVIKVEPVDNNNDVIYVSDSDCDTWSKQTCEGAKKQKLEVVCEEPQKPLLKDNENKNENDLELEAFNVKQAYLGYDEPIPIDSESDSESEQWLLRLSQSSPGKPFIKMAKSPKPEVKQEDSSYTQLDDFVCMNKLIFEEDDEDLFDDITSIPDNVITIPNDIISIPKLDDHISDEFPEKDATGTLREGTNIYDKNELKELSDGIICKAGPVLSFKADQIKDRQSIDEADGFTDKVQKQMNNINKSAVNDNSKKTQLIEPRIHIPKGRNLSVSECMYICPIYCLSYALSLILDYDHESFNLNCVEYIFHSSWLPCKNV